MWGSTILDVAVGVVFGFLAISLFTSAAVEAINSFFKLRATNLKSGVQALLNDPNFTGLAKQLYEHASVSPLGPGRTNAPDTYSNTKNLPSYIDKLQFAGALLDVTGLSAESATGAAQAPGPQAVAAFKARIDQLKSSGQIDSQIGQLLEGIVNRTAGDIKKIETELGNWFDFGMDRVGGAFKRWTLVWTFVIALPIAVIFNMDSIRIGTQLWEHASLAEALKAYEVPSVNNGAAPSEDQALTEIREISEAGLPIGWTPGHFFQTLDVDGEWHPLSARPGAFIRSVVGWIVTATAALFGAPFWFDALQTIIRLKGSGPSPAEKENKTAASS
jgi:hypothetical protein